MKLKDERIIEYIKKIRTEENFNLEKFLEPSLDDLRDPKKFVDIDKATAKIKTAISENKKILVYGDYDSDGICATTILYLYLSSIGAKVQVFIPNRFENGYGISVDAIEEILADFQPDLMITVDLGITAVEEVEIIKQEGIDIVITDHHLPLAEVPDCVIIDPKYNNQDYGFEGLCGAGVAYKLVEALSDRETANRYLDICAIATVGDIVPLVDENRVIAKFGIDKINSGDCLPSITFMKEKLGLEKITSTDISFKIVPRLNACGRMDNALKVFEFLIQTDNNLLEEKYAEIESDNTVRLATIDKGNKIVAELLKKQDIMEPSILISGDFHEGTVGIIASKISHEYNKPTIIFAKTEDGSLKGSGRSIPQVDLHQIISTMSDKLINFGGHKMAVGVEIAPESFESFKQELNEKILNFASFEDFVIDNSFYDIEITEDDLNISFAKQLELLEPFGEGNEKPVLMLKENEMNVLPISEKTYKHYKCFTRKNIPIVCFNFYNESFIMKSSSTKQLYVDLSLGTFKDKEQLGIYCRNLKISDPKLSENDEQEFLTSLYNLYYSIFDFNDEKRYHLTENIKEIIKKKFEESRFGTVVVASNNEDLNIVKELGLEKFINDKAYKNAQNVVVVSPRQIHSLSEVSGYKNIIFLHRYFDGEHLYFSQSLDVFEPQEKTNCCFEISKERDVFARVYKLVTSFAELKANDILDFVKKVSLKDTSLSVSQILFSTIVFMELNFLEFDDILGALRVLKAKKTEISNSKFYNAVEV